MEIISIEEQEDGSALVQVNFTADEIHKLIETALIIGLTEGLIKIKEEKLNDLKSETDMGNPQCRNPNCVYGPCVEPEQSGQSADSFKTSQVLG